jgi:hypothetical protein
MLFGAFKTITYFVVVEECHLLHFVTQLVDFSVKAFVVINVPLLRINDAHDDLGTGQLDNLHSFLEQAPLPFCKAHL